MAGTSIDAINAAIIVSYVMENNTWDGSAERLSEFWEYVSKESSFDLIPGVTAWWDYLHNNVHSGIASGEQEDIIQQRNFQLQECLQFFPP